jgi:hypothetical protein
VLKLVQETAFSQAVFLWSEVGMMMMMMMMMMSVLVHDILFLCNSLVRRASSDARSEAISLEVTFLVD